MNLSPVVNFDMHIDFLNNAKVVINLIIHLAKLIIISLF